MAKKTAEAVSKGGGGGLIGFLLATLIAVAVGAGFGFFLDSHLKSSAKVQPAPEAETAKPAAAKPAPVVSPTAKLVPLVPVVANLAEPKDAWIRVEASILVDGEIVGIEVLAARLAEDFVAYLRTTTLSQFEGASGFQNLRDDLVDRAAIRDQQIIKDVIIHGVVIE